ncbi:MAG: TIGR03560 family F420-dependent LLM class oxidoreductase [Pseudomonadales bacterium]|nr:TIGR03560 family F420-dependent LLM class oxidoreductase [Pseudomonadales bacterium]
MRFSFWPTPSLPFEETLSLSQHAEATGWDGLWLADHFMPNAQDTSTPWPEAWTTLSAIAATVPRLRLGTLVTGNTYRHPAVLAKMAATVDHISGGRVVLGIGSGWQENEHAQYGIEFDTVGGRLDRLDEACTVIRALFTEQTASFSGAHYQLENAILEPKPVQKPLPLLIGGGGEKVTLKLAAKHANEWNVWGDPSILRHKMSVLDKHCTDLGRDPREIHRTAVALLFMSEDKKFLENMRNADITQPKIVGTPAEVKEIVAEYEAAGVAELIVPDFTMGSGDQKIATMDTFITQVAGR